MTEVLARMSYDDPRAEVRRIVAIVALMIAGSVGWYGVRGNLTQWLARSSIGCYGREELIRAALRRHDVTVPKDARLWGHSLPRPGWIAWTAVHEIEHLTDRPTLSKWHITVADSDFSVRGVIPGDYLCGQPPIDLVGDGTWAVLVEVPPAGLGSAKDITYWAVLRLHAGFNEVIWLGLVDGSKWAGAGVRVKPVWRDGERCAKKDLAFITVVTARGPGGGIVFKPPETVAVFRLGGEHGLLRPALLPDDGGIIPWNPPSDAPVRIGQTAELEPVFRRLLPVPQRQSE